MTKEETYSGMLKKVLTISTSIIMLLAMMTNIVLPVYAVNSNIRQKPPVESGVYCIQSMVGNNMFLDINGPSVEDSAQIQIYTKHELFGTQYATPTFLNQEFYLWYDYSDGCYTIIPMHTVVNGAGEVIEDSPKCIGVENSIAGTNVFQRDLCFYDNFKWVIDKCDNGQIEFTLKSTLQSNNKLKLEVCRGENGYGNNSLVQINNGNSSNAQKFKLSNWEPSKKNLSEPKALKRL